MINTLDLADEHVGADSRRRLPQYPSPRRESGFEEAAGGCEPGQVSPGPGVVHMIFPLPPRPFLLAGGVRATSSPISRFPTSGSRSRPFRATPGRVRRAGSVVGPGTASDVPAERGSDLPGQARPHPLRAGKEHAPTPSTCFEEGPQPAADTAQALAERCRAGGSRSHVLVDARRILNDAVAVPRLADRGRVRSLGPSYRPLSPWTIDRRQQPQSPPQSWVGGRGGFGVTGGLGDERQVWERRRQGREGQVARHRTSGWRARLVAQLQGRVRRQLARGDRRRPGEGPPITSPWPIEAKGHGGLADRTQLAGRGW